MNDLLIGPTERRTRSRALQRRAHELIPGGCHTYAKGDDQYPELAPAFLARGHGCHVWDPDGNEYIEYGMGLRAVTLGHAHPAVVEAVYEAIRSGTNFTRPSPIEVECAEALLALIPGAEMVKFAKNGSDVTTAAVKLARAYTGRDMVAVCADQPFFSTDDWFIGTTPMAAGIPAAIRELTVTFHYNDIASVRALFDRYPGRIACLIMEPATAIEPRDGFLHEVQALCRANGALLIFDEMITGFRWSLSGAQGVYGVTPDLSTFGKALGNGFAVSALVGRREIMERGGLHHPHERVFLLSTTHGADTTGLAAALATMRVYREEPVIETLYRQGERLRRGVEQAITAAGVEGFFEVIGRPCNLIFVTRDSTGERSQPFRTLFMQELIRGGVIAPSFVVSYAHSDDDIDRTIEVVHDALRVYRAALDDGVEPYLIGPSVKPVFRRFNRDRSDSTGSGRRMSPTTLEASVTRFADYVPVDRTRCRFCGAPLQHTFVDLGMSPLCESYISREQLNQMEPFYPLHVYVCGRCYLVQLQEYVSGEEIFREYAYFSSYSTSWLEHCRRYCDHVVSRFGLGPRSQVIEVASNDGYALQYFVQRGIPSLGIEPAVNVARVAIEKGIPTRVEFFGRDLARRLVAEGYRADLLFGKNVLAQVHDLNDFVGGLKILLAPGGVITIEFPHLERLIEENQFDTIYHEHFSYFSFLVVQTIFAAHGLTLFDVEELPTHGGSLRIYARHAEDRSKPVSENVRALAERERAAGVLSLDYYRSFGERVKETKRRLLEFLIRVRREGKTVVGYGAPGKGNTLLNYCGIGTDFLDYTVDRNPYKQGKYLPGTHIPIYAPEKIDETRPDYVLILPWNLKDEIMAQMAHIREWGGQFVVPIPTTTVYP